MRSLLTLLFVLLLVVGVGSVVAQETPQVFCGNLAPGDCDILIASSDAMSGLRAAAFDANLNMDVGVGVENVTLTMNGVGRFAITNPNTGILSSDAFLSDDLGELLSAFSKLMGDFEADVALVFSLVDAVSGTEQIALDFRVVDGFMYINTDDFDMAGFGSGWIGIDLAGLMREIAENPDLIDALSAGSSGSIASDPADPTFANTFSTIERIGDATIDGQQAATFVTTIDIGGLMSAPELQEIVIDSLAQEGLGGTATARFMMSLLSDAFDGSTMTTMQHIGLNDHYVHNTDIVFGFKLSGDLLELMTDTPASNIGGVSFTMDIHLGLSDFNDVMAVNEPAGAFIFPLESILPLLTGGSAF